MLSQSEIKKLFNYNPGTGEVTRLVANSNFVRVGDNPGWIENTGYYRVHIGGKSYLLHKVIWMYMTGEWPKFDIDHIDRNRLNNKWDNLRKATRSANMANGGKRESLTGFTGVYQNKSGYMSKIKIGNQQVYLGQFKTPEEAYEAFKLKHREVHGEFSRYANEHNA